MEEEVELSRVLVVEAVAGRGGRGARVCGVEGRSLSG